MSFALRTIKTNETTRRAGEKDSWFCGLTFVPFWRVGLVLLLATPLMAEDWPEFRGPTGQGISTEKNLPAEWGPDKNVKWKAKIAGRGWSSPVVVKGRIYLTTPVP